MILANATLEAAEKIALHRSGSDTLASTQAAPIDAIQVLLKDHFLEALAGSLAWLHSRQLLAKAAAAIEAAALAHLQVQDASSESPVVMADGSAAPALVSKARTSALGARYRSGIPGRYRNRAAVALDVDNLVLG
jgi:hypothetical protein